MIFIYLSMFFTTMALFIYEALLTRLFSAVLSHNLVFIVVSLTILGGGIGAILSYKVFKKKINGKWILVVASISLPISFLISISIMYFLPFIPTFLIYIPAALIPFILGGIITATIFTEKPTHSNKLYLMDLLGSALGSLLIIKLMNSFGFLRSIIATSIFAIMGALGISIFHRKRQAIVACTGALVLMSILFMNNSLVETIGKNFYSYYTSPATMIGSSENPKNISISFSKWDAISRTDVLDIKDGSKKYIVTDGGAAAPIVRFDGNLDSLQKMKYDVNYIPFSFGKNEKSLVIGSGGGKDVLYALLGGSKKIDAVEINPSTIEAVEKFKEYGGDIYNYPGVTLYNQDGRYFIENSQDKYDNIYLSMVMTNSIESNMYTLAEYYIFTEEAFREYFNHLSNDGRLSIMVHDETELVKIVNTGIKVLMDRGVSQKDITNYFVIANGITSEETVLHGSEIAMPLVTFNNTPFTEEEINSIVNVANSQNRVLIHYRGKEVEPYKAFKNGQLNYKELINKIGFASKPITDNSPFFYDNSRFIPIQLALVMVSIMLLWLTIRKKFLKSPKQRKASAYFGILGAAYMLVEIPIIQKTVLYFGSSSIAFSLVVFSLLVSSGIGSLVSGTKIVEKLAAKAPYYILTSGIMVAINQIGLSTTLRLTMDWPLSYKAIVIFFSLFPMGFLMGMAYPSGIKKLGKMENEDGLVPLMCGVNGIFSVLGSTLAVVISMKLGFNITVYFGAALYIILYTLNPLRVFEESDLFSEKII